MKKEKNELYLVCSVIADRVKRRLLLTEDTIKNLHNLNYYSTKLYFKYKMRYPNYEEVVIPNLKAMPLNIEI